MSDEELIQEFHKKTIAALSPHPESICQNCGGENPVWSADNDLWNKINGSPDGILCPNCFVKKGIARGINMFGLNIPDYKEQLKKRIENSQRRTI